MARVETQPERSLPDRQRLLVQFEGDLLEDVDRPVGEDDAVGEAVRSFHGQPIDGDVDRGAMIAPVECQHHSRLDVVRCLEGHQTGLCFCGADERFLLE